MRISRTQLDEDRRRFFKLFTESTLEGSQDAAREMTTIADRQTEHNQKALSYYSLCLLMHTKSEKLLWPNSPLLVLLPSVDPNMVIGEEHDENRCTLLHQLVVLADPTRSDSSIYENQLTMGRQLIGHGANVNALAFPKGETPLHTACHSSVTTNLHFIQLLLKRVQIQMPRTIWAGHRLCIPSRGLPVRPNLCWGVLPRM
jgi:hypothetical protein